MTDPIDFQLEENRWAAQMACDEANSGLPCKAWLVAGVTHYNSAIYALALRILRTETPPVDPDLIRARKLMTEFYEADGSKMAAQAALNGELDNNACIKAVLVALKEGRKP